MTSTAFGIIVPVPIRWKAMPAANGEGDLSKVLEFVLNFGNHTCQSTKERLCLPYALLNVWKDHGPPELPILFPFRILSE